MKTIEYSQLKQLQQKSVAIVNVLSSEAFQRAHIPGSVNISHEDIRFAEQVENALGGKNVPVVLYCASYACDASRKAARKLDQEGFTDIMCYEGGMKEWQEKASAYAA